VYKSHYKTFFEANPELLHFTAHSHHPWPDVTRKAHMQYWDDAAKLTDQKWDHIFGKIVPQAQRRIADIIGVSSPSSICFAPNTHEFVARIFSCFNPEKPLRILTTDGEFHSFSRQVRRYEELPYVAVTRVSVLPFETFEERFSQAASSADFDLVFLSHVFFTYGFAIKNIKRIVESIRSKDAVVVLDGYHAFCALPFSLGELSERVFYLGGGYKYAQSGEGVCFMHVPPDCKLRPINTGWFSSFVELETTPSLGRPVEYGQDAFRFWGATFDPSGIYRFIAMRSWLEGLSLGIADIHLYVRTLQSYFVEKVKSGASKLLNTRNILLSDSLWHGHFLTFNVPNAHEVSARLRELNISTDSRGDFLRFGFGIYQDRDDVEQLFKRFRANSL
jgi:kynureninase